MQPVFWETTILFTQAQKSIIVTLTMIIEHDCSMNSGCFYNISSEYSFGVKEVFDHIDFLAKGGKLRSCYRVIGVEGAV